jgi:hypothetical protein
VGTEDPFSDKVGKREADRLPATSVEIGMSETVPLLPHTSSCRLASTGELCLAVGNMFAWVKLRIPSNTHSQPQYLTLRWSVRNLKLEIYVFTIV